jgi:hypothetical protein
MDTQGTPVGLAIKAALDRGVELKARSARKLNVRVWPILDGEQARLQIRASVAARTNEELEAQAGLGVREVPLEALDGRAHELPALVDAAVAEVEAAVAAAPAPPARPSCADADIDADAFEALIEAAALRFTDVAKSLHEAAPTSLSSGGALEAVLVGLSKAFALAGTAGGMPASELQSLVQDAASELRSKLAGGAPARLKPHLDA